MKSKADEWLQPEKLILIEGWARDGLTDEQIAHNVGVAYSTLRLWKDKHSAILAALKKGKEVADREVENALYKSACGYDFEECTYERRFDKATGQYILVCIKKVTKHIPPSNTAQIFWLKNRKPEVWRDRQEITDTTALEKLDDILGELKNEADRETE